MISWHGVQVFLGHVRNAVIKSTIVVGFLLHVGVAVVGLAVLSNYDRFADDFVAPDALSINQPSTGAVVVDRHGRFLYQYVDDRGVRLPVALDQISPNLIAATIATEDASFYSNAGINVRGLARAAMENASYFTDEKTFQGTGGSSITQQLVKNVYIPADLRTERSLERKLREIVYSLEMTKYYDKDQILQWYLNQIAYGGIYTGVEAASQAYFGKPANELTLGQAALLAGIPQSPAAFDPITNPEAAIARRNEVLDLMVAHSPIQTGPDSYYTPTPEEIEAARNEPVEIKPVTHPVEAPHFVFTYIAPQLESLVGADAVRRGGLKVTTTIDLELQHRAQEIMEQWIREFERISNTHNGATMIVDPRTGEILVMIGSRDFYREDIDGNVNNLLAGNSPGSTFKPFVYLTTFEKLGWHSETIIDDSPVSYREFNGTVFSPTNPSGGYVGPITLRNALGNSLNVPAFKAALAVGANNIVDFAKRVGFTSLNEYYGPSIATGGVDLRAFDLTYGYAAIANGGVLAGQDTFAPDRPDERTIEPIGILKIEDSRGNVLFDVEQHRAQAQVIRPDHAWMMADILSDPNARCMTFGCGGLAVPGHRVGVKTGTSEPYDPKGPNRGKIGETWAFGITQDFAVGVWAGNSNNDPIVNIFSTSISYRAMRDIMLAAYAAGAQARASR